MSGREGGKLKPLKQPKKEKKELDDVSARTKKRSLFMSFKIHFFFAGGYGAAKEEQRATEKARRSSQNSRSKRTS